MLVLLLVPGLAHGQGHQPGALHIGDMMPASLSKSIMLAGTGKSKYESAPPKLMIIHFWDGSCSASLSEIPKLDSLQQRFMGQLQVVVVAPDSKLKVDAAFKKIGYHPVRAKIISGDQLLHGLFPHSTVPHHVWINEQGKVIYITQSYNATDKNVYAALNGINLKLIEKKDDTTYSIEQPLWTKINGEKNNAVQFASTLTQMLPGISSGTLKIYDTAAAVTGIRITNQTLLSLYKIAYSATKKVEYDMDNRIILDVKDPSMFKLPADKNLWNDWFPKNLYSYELFVPLEYKAQLYTIMQGDLEKAFGYGAKVEERKVRCLVLHSEPDNRLITSKGGAPYKGKSGGKLIIRNQPIHSSLFSAIKYANEANPLPFLDETGSEKIDIEITSGLNDLDALRIELHKYGLELMEQERVIPMLVIAPKKNR